MTALPHLGPANTMYICITVIRLPRRRVPPPLSTFSLIWGWGHVHLVPYTPMKCRGGTGPDSERLNWIKIYDQIS